LRSTKLPILRRLVVSAPHIATTVAHPESFQAAWTPLFFQPS
jgi:hypothetical protein